ncbi:MAG: VCBS repeat-containing protein [Flavobacteriales bacterium]|nr:VCBS repeat-containing protein [Flavobacteriales bacterium]
MKTLQITRSATLSLAISFAWSGFGQQSTFKLAYDDAVGGGALSAQNLPANNLNGVLVDDTYIMESLLVMYKRTNDLAYLQLFISHADKVINARDDVHIGGTTIANYLHQVEPTWVSQHLTNEPYAFVYASGMLLWPLAEYCRIVSLNPSYYATVNATNTGGLVYNTQTLKWIADDLHTRIFETCSIHDDEFMVQTLPSWYGSSVVGGGYVYPCDILNCSDIHPGCFLPLNMQSVMGKVHLTMYMATSSTNASRKAYYKEKAIRIANTLRMSMVHHSDPNYAHYTWPYWPYWPSGYVANYCDPQAFMCDYASAEDRGHAYLNSSFAFMCYEYVLPYQIGGTSVVFDGTDMAHIAATFKNHYEHPLQYFERIDRTGNVTYGSYNFNYPDALTELAQWIPFSRIDEDIWQAMSEIYTKRSVLRQEGSGTWLLGVANCLYYQDELDPIVVGEHGMASEWRGAAIGDLDADGEPEIAAVRDFDGDIYLYDWLEQNEQCSMTSNGQTIPFGSASDWIGLAAGDIDGQLGDELIAARNYDHTIFVFNWGTQWFSVPISTGIVNVSGIAAGDINGDGDSEVVLSTYNGALMVYDFDPNQQVLVHQITQQVITSGDVPCIATANMAGTAADEVILANNADNTVRVYAYDQQQLAFGLLGSYNASGPMNWRGAAGGQFDSGNAREECVVVSYADGDLYFLEFNSQGQLIVFDRANLMGPITSNGNLVSALRHSVIASGDLTWRSDACCPMDELINYRNEDGWCYAYELRTGARCIPMVECDVKSGQVPEADGAGVRLYPNPATAQVFLEALDDRSNGIQAIICLDNLGRVVLSGRYPVGSMRIVLGTGKLSIGVYAVRTTTWSGSQSQERLIIE